MDWPLLLLFVSFLTGTRWRSVCSTCVFDSDFGFTLKCGFKKSSIFRVRNLGGVKSYFGLGFSLGDELGFPESLNNVESLNRRSVHSARSAAGYFQPLFTTTQTPAPVISPLSAALRIENNKSENSAVGSNRSSHAINLRSPVDRHISSSPLQQRALTSNVVPPFRPIHPGGQKSSNQVTRITKIRGDEDPVTIVAVPAFASLPPSIVKIPAAHSSQVVSNAANNRRISYNPLINQQPQLLMSQPVDPLPLSSNSIAQLRVVAPAGPATVPAVDSFLPEAVGHALKNVAQATNISADALLASIQLRQQQMLYQQQKQLAALAAAATTTTASPVAVTNPAYVQGTPPSLPFVNNIKNTYVPSDGSDSDNEVAGSGVGAAIVAYTSPNGAVNNGANGNSVALEQLSAPKTNAQPPNRQKYTLAGTHKVMNAPKEYYPVNYDKNFDDNFTSRVELPDTSFSCGDQKHFPGLYADEDLNCMITSVLYITSPLFRDESREHIKRYEDIGPTVPARDDSVDVASIFLVLVGFGAFVLSTVGLYAVYRTSPKLLIPFLIWKAVHILLEAYLLILAAFYVPIIGIPIALVLLVLSAYTLLVIFSYYQDVTEEKEVEPVDA